MSAQASLKHLIRKYIREVLKELEETSFSSGAGPYNTPFAFSGGKRKDKKKKKEVATNSTGYAIVEAAKERKVVLELPKKIYGGVRVVFNNKKEAEKYMEDHIPSEAWKHVKIRSQMVPVREAVDISKMRAQIKAELDKIPKHYETMKKWSGVDIPKANRAKDRMNAAKKRAEDLQDKINALKKKESVNEGKYHDYRNDDSITPKQKIGRSMREIRDHLTEIDKLTKMNVRLKTEMGVDSRSYWKNTHKAMRRISERLIKLAKRVGQLY